MKIIFITGTGTEVGKTHCACALIDILRHRPQSDESAGRDEIDPPRVGVYKPVASGCDSDLVASDAVKLWHTAGQPLSLAEVCPQKFRHPLAPPEAARLSGTRVDEKLLYDGIQPWADRSFDVLVIEGAGGLFSPLSDQMLNLDYLSGLRVRFNEVETVLVAGDRLGVIHDVLACTRAAEAAHTPVDRVILNRLPGLQDPSFDSNLEMIRRWTNLPVEIHFPEKQR